MSDPKHHQKIWSDEATDWWLDGENTERVTVRPGDMCLFEETPFGGLILREVQSRGSVQ